DHARPRALFHAIHISIPPRQVHSAPHPPQTVKSREQRSPNRALARHLAPRASVVPCSLVRSSSPAGRSESGSYMSHVLAEGQYRLSRSAAAADTSSLVSFPRPHVRPPRRARHPLSAPSSLLRATLNHSNFADISSSSEQDEESGKSARSPRSAALRSHLSAFFRPGRGRGGRGGLGWAGAHFWGDFREHERGRGRGSGMGTARRTVRGILGTTASTKTRERVSTRMRTGYSALRFICEPLATSTPLLGRSSARSPSGIRPVSAGAPIVRISASYVLLCQLTPVHEAEINSAFASAHCRCIVEIAAVLMELQRPGMASRPSGN
ncbi:hypothetical protein DFH07DRAFT_1037207, partial [Mycena maculata]